MGIFDKWPKKRDNVKPEPESVVGTVKPGSEDPYKDLSSDYSEQIGEADHNNVYDLNDAEKNHTPETEGWVNKKKE